MADTPSVVMTERSDMPRDVTATTPGDMPNIRVKVMSAASIVLVRTIRTFLQTFVAGLVGGAAAGNVPLVSDALAASSFDERVAAAGYLALIAAFIAAVQNILELVSKVDESLPEWRA